MQELYKAALLMPWSFWAIMGSMVLIAGWAFWHCTRPSKRIDHQFYDYWIKKINSELKRCRRVPNRNGGREKEYRRTFAWLQFELEEQMGHGPNDFNHMSTSERGIWIHLMTRWRDVLFFY